eukprot:g5950.t1
MALRLLLLSSCFALAWAASSDAGVASVEIDPATGEAVAPPKPAGYNLTEDVDQMLEYVTMLEEMTDVITGTTADGKKVERGGDSDPFAWKPDPEPTHELRPGVRASPEERAALVEFFQSTGGDKYWDDKTRWLSGDPCTNMWFGVQCDNFGVAALALPANKVNGTIPDSIGDLAHLQVLDICLNYIK